MARGSVILGNGGIICLHNGSIVLADGVERKYVGNVPYDVWRQTAQTDDCRIDTTYRTLRSERGVQPSFSELFAGTGLTQIGGATTVSTYPYRGILGYSYYKCQGAYVAGQFDYLDYHSEGRLESSCIYDISVAGFLPISSGVAPVLKYKTTVCVFRGWFDGTLGSRVNPPYSEWIRYDSDVVWPLKMTRGTVSPWSSTVSGTRSAYRQYSFLGSGYVPFDGSFPMPNGTVQLADESINLYGVAIPAFGVGSSDFTYGGETVEIPVPVRTGTISGSIEISGYRSFTS